MLARRSATLGGCGRGRQEAVGGTADAPQRGPELGLDVPRGREETELCLGHLEEVLTRQLQLVRVSCGRDADVEFICGGGRREGGRGEAK